MGTTAPGPIHLLELCDQKLMEFVCNVDNKDLVWLEEIKEEAKRMFTREFSKEPELMPKTPSQKNRRKKKRISYVQDENRDPIRKRLSRRKTRSSRLSSRHLHSKDKVEQLAMVVGENGSIPRRVTRAAAAAAAATMASASPTSESPTVLTRKPKNSVAQGQLVPVVEIGVSERCSAEQCLSQLSSARALSPAPSPTLAPATAPTSQIILTSDEESTLKKSEAGRQESVAISSLMATPQDPKGRGVKADRSVSKLRIARTSPVRQDSPGSPASPWQARVLAPILPDNFSTPKGSLVDRQSVRRSLIAPSSPGPQNSVAQKYSMVAKTESAVRRSSRRIAKKATTEPAASARIICHSYLERLLNVEVPQKVSPEEDPSKVTEPVEGAELEVPKNEGSTLLSCSATKIAISTPGLQPVAGGQETPSVGQREAKINQADGPKEPPQSVRRKRSYKQAVSELDEEQQLEEEELQPPQSKTPSPPCPASKVVRPLRTFLHTVQRNQMLMTPTSASRSSVMKSFIKRNTPLRVDPKEKERQRLETLRRKEEAEQLRRQKVEEDKRRRLEEVKLKREERLRKVLQARERVEQLKEEKKKQIEQKFAQLDEKTEKAKEERLAEEKAKKKAAAKKMEEVEVRRRQEEEARRLRWLQQEEEERRHQELLQKKKEEEEQERLRKAAEAKRLAEQREQERHEQERRREQERLQAERELQEREKALQLQKEKLQRELEEKKRKEEQQRLQEEQEKKAKEAAVASKGLNTTVDVQSPACTSYQMTPQGHRAPPKINPDNYGMDLNSDDSTDDESHPRKPIPSWARGTQLSQAIIHQYYHPPNLLELFGTILQLDLEDIFKKSKPRYHKRTSSAVWNSPPLQGARVPSSLAYSLKKF
ncbi:PREDICTED: inner centromere protein [Miniopterus natalensis]|uniref:inner centromere protein n=1 Tax=Miniopterus natalensis TaxID=291302 RepID=UPI0007A70C20|nr:PREDICTED: inner centromere protein [Miniopterus natalensis]